MLVRSSRFVLPGLIALVAAVPPASAGLAQVVTASGGVLAQGYVPDATFPDGSTRWFEVTLGVPGGAVTSTGVAGPVDVSRPWAVVTETIVSGAHGSQQENGLQVCGQAQNPLRSSAGTVTGTTWTGAFVDVTCNDHTGYEFFRVGWDAGPYWMVTSPVATAPMGGQVTQWSAPDVRGTVTLWPTANQQSRVTVCGYHSAQSQPDCFGRASGYGAIVQSATGMVTEAIATG